MKLLVDMNLSPRWIAFLTAAEHDAVHWSNVGAPDAPDEALMLWAHENGHVVLTQDLDFGTILAAQRVASPSVVQIRSDDLSIEKPCSSFHAKSNRAC
jgi:predicted nuclease of predicted toxin-antitoxin system